jgi:glucose-6-phosphate isomerase
MHQNLPVLMGLIGVWNSTFLGHATKAILPYSQALLRFPAHIQQLGAFIEIQFLLFYFF